MNVRFVTLLCLCNAKFCTLSQLRLEKKILVWFGPLLIDKIKFVRRDALKEWKIFVVPDYGLVVFKTFK